MSIKIFLDLLRSTKIICVVRTESDVDLLPAFDSLIKGGISLIEITSTCPSFIDRLPGYIMHIKSKGALCGVGTILDENMAKECVKIGSDFIVSPVFDKDIVSFCCHQQIPVIPGCMTPTEIFEAWKNGATVIKTFPGRVCTPDFYKDILGPFPDIRLLPTGNVNEKTAPEYLRAGAVGVGVGKALISEDIIINKKWENIINQARYFVNLLKISEKGNSYARP